MPDLDLDALLDLAQGAMDEAVALVLRGPHSRTFPKGDDDLVTAVEFIVERRVRERLLDRSPEHDFGFLGEETGSVGNRELYWVLDPIDGTVNFAHGMPLCAIALGLVHHHEPILGVVSLPFIGRRYWAARGRGAFRDQAPITPSTTETWDEAVVALSDYGMGAQNSVLNRISRDLDDALTQQTRRVRRLGSSALDLVWVADGTLDAAITLGNHPWDTAAATIIAREAGAIVTDADRSLHTTSSHAVIALSPHLRDDPIPALELLRGTRYWPTPTPSEPGGRATSRQAGTIAYLATITLGIGDDDTAATITDTECATIDLARAWVENTLPTTPFPEHILQRPRGTLGAYLLGSIRKGRHALAANGTVSWEPDDKPGNLDATMINNKVHWSAPC